MTDFDMVPETLELPNGSLLTTSHHDDQLETSTDQDEAVLGTVSHQVVHHSARTNALNSLTLGCLARNLLLPFINGLALGFGELLAHELCWRIGWPARSVRVYPESRQSAFL